MTNHDTLTAVDPRLRPRRTSHIKQYRRESRVYPEIKLAAKG
jgi:hypothetical protein